MQSSTRIELGELVCWWCGYGLEGVDLIRTDLHCPECGKENVPGNGPDAPLVRRRWPAWWALAATLCWPGLLLGLSIAAPPLLPGARSLEGLRAALAVMALPSGLMCILWSPLMSELIIDERVAGMYKRRWLLGVALGGVLANGVLAWAIALAARLLG